MRNEAPWPQPPTPPVSVHAGEEGEEDEVPGIRLRPCKRCLVGSEGETAVLHVEGADGL